MIDHTTKLSKPSNYHLIEVTSDLTITLHIVRLNEWLNQFQLILVVYLTW